MQYSEASSTNDRAAGEGPIARERVFLGASQREAVDALRRTLAERHVFTALTGAPGLGKTTALAMAIAAQSRIVQPGPPCRIIKLDRADQVSAEQAAGIERLVLRQSATVGRQHNVIIVDDAHAAPLFLLQCLTRIAEHCRLNPGAAQVILVGRPDLWGRLSPPNFAPLVERIAARPVLQRMTDDDVRGLIKHALDQPRRVLGQALTEDAEREVLRLAAGRPERIGAIMRSTLTLSDVQARVPISIEMIGSVAAMLDGLQPGQRRKPRARLLKPALATAAAVALVAGVTVAASGWTPERLLPAALDLAHDAIAPWRKPPVDRGASRLAEAVPAPNPAPNPALAAPDDGAGRRVSRAQPPAQPLPPTPASPEMQDQPPAAPTASLALAGQPLGADRAPSAAEPPRFAATAQPPAPQVSPEPGVAGLDSAANLPPVPGTAPARPAPALVTALLRRGDEELALGDISTARRFYERTIAAGSAQGARGIARTYDPEVLGRGNPAANPATAAAWYNMAVTLGDVEDVVRQSAPKGKR